MKTFRRNTSLILRLSKTIAIAAMISGCGTSSPHSDIHAAIQGTLPPPSQGAGAGAAVPGTIPVSDASGISVNELQQLSGTYGGTIQRIDPIFDSIVGVQEYRFTLSRKDANGYRYAYLVFQSSGPLGEIGFEAYLGASLVNYYGTYGLYSAPGSVPSLSNSPIAVQLLLTLAGGQLVPVQSKIDIKDCGFSQVVCSASLQTVRFADDLKKLSP